jgi:hypothetical protein
MYISMCGLHQWELRFVGSFIVAVCILLVVILLCQAVPLFGHYTLPIIIMTGALMLAYWNEKHQAEKMNGGDAASMVSYVSNVDTNAMQQKATGFFHGLINIGKAAVGTINDVAKELAMK